MKLVHAWISFGLVGVCLVASIAAGCSDDETSNNPAPDAGTDSPTSTPDTGVPDTSTGMDSSVVDPAVIARGKYIVENLGACGDCHTPRKPDGSLDQTKALSGVDCFVDAFPADNAAGCLSSANLTNDATGLKNRTDAEIKTMLTTGKKPDGKFLSNVMPYYAIANMKPADLDATVAFLRTVSGISHTVQANQPPFANVAAASPPIDATKVPPAGAGANENGRYLAMLVCLECHTPEASIGQTSPIDMTKMFAGGRAYQLGLPSPPFPATIFSANITPHATSGISAWTAADIVKVLKQGRDREDAGVCPPMPVGPMGAFGGMTDPALSRHCEGSQQERAHRHGRHLLFDDRLRPVRCWRLTHRWRPTARAPHASIRVAFSDSVGDRCSLRLTEVCGGPSRSRRDLRPCADARCAPIASRHARDGCRRARVWGRRESLVVPNRKVVPSQTSAGANAFDGKDFAKTHAFADEEGTSRRRRRCRMELLNGARRADQWLFAVVSDARLRAMMQARSRESRTGSIS